MEGVGLKNIPEACRGGQLSIDEGQCVGMETRRKV